MSDALWTRTLLVPRGMMTLVLIPPSTLVSIRELALVHGSALIHRLMWICGLVSICGLASILLTPELTPVPSCLSHPPGCGMQDPVSPLSANPRLTPILV